MASGKVNESVDCPVEWLRYEHQMVKAHISNHPTATVFHWTHVPETMLKESGYIHDLNQWRLKRKREYDPTSPYLNPISDYGLDGMAQISTGEFHGLQAKRRKTGYLRAADLGTFSFVTNRMREKYPDSKGVVYTDAKLTRELRDDLELCSAYSVHHMELEDHSSACLDDSKHSFAASNAPVHTPWPHQVEATDALDEWNGRFGALVMPPGSGKTLVMTLWSAKHHHVVVCSPTRVLATQTLDTMRGMMPNHRCLLIDSDTAGTRDVSVVKAALTHESPLLISTTFQSLCDLLAPLLSTELVVVDEGHHAFTGTHLRRTLDLLRCRVLLVTGTPPAALDETDEVELVYQYDYDRAVADGRICDFRIYLPLVVDPLDDSDHDDLVSRLGQDIVSRCHFVANGMLRTGSTRCIIYASNVAEAAEYAQAIEQLSSQFHGIHAWTACITGDTPTALRTELLARFQADDPMHRWFFMCAVRVLDEGVDIPACDAVYVASSVGNEARFIQRICRANRLDYPCKLASVFVWSDDRDATLKSTARVVSSLGRAKPVVSLVSTDYTHAVQAEDDDDLMHRVRVLCVTAREHWVANLGRLEAFIELNGKLPRGGAGDSAERRLGAWLNNQKMNYSAAPENCKRIMKTMHGEWTAIIQKYPILFESFDDVWRRSAGEIEAFVQRTGKCPSTQSKDAAEKRLGNWLHTQRTNYSAVPENCKGMMKSMHGEWTATIQKYPILSETSDDVWRRSAGEIEAFVQRTGRCPSTTSKDAAEKRLGSWLYTQRKNYSAVPANCKQIMRSMHGEWTAIIQKYPILSETSDDVWRQSASELEAFVQRTGKCPSTTSKDAAEKRLGTWLYTQRKNYSAVPANCKQIMRSMHGEWTAIIQKYPILSENFDDVWRRSASELEAFVQRTGKCPSTQSKDAAEKRLGRWLGHQRNSYSAVPANCKGMMKSMHGEWTATIQKYPILFETLDDVWRRSAGEIEAFVQRTGKCPSKQSKDAAEKRLGTWLCSQKGNYSAVPANCKYTMKTMHGEWTAIIQKHPILSETLDDVWRRSAGEFEAFVRRTGKCPSKQSKDAAEKRLGTWLNNQKGNYNAAPANCNFIMKSMHGEWTAIIQRYPILSETLDDVWRRSASELEAFVQRTGKCPSQKSKDAVEKRLGNWLGTQRKNYSAVPANCKYIMKTVTVHAIWSALIEKYPILLRARRVARNPNSNVPSSTPSASSAIVFTDSDASTRSSDRCDATCTSMSDMCDN
jgi:superfamily II DNA or RNA helicase